jgi:hypothetical protein
MPPVLDRAFEVVDGGRSDDDIDDEGMLVGRMAGVLKPDLNSAHAQLIEKARINQADSDL